MRNVSNHSRSPLMSENSSIEKYEPSKEEARIILKANSIFIGRYITGIFAGFTTAFIALRFKNTRTRSWPGFITYFTLGLAGEFMGRQYGVLGAQRELANLPQDSRLRGLIEKM